MIQLTPPLRESQTQRHLLHDLHGDSSKIPIRHGQCFFSNCVRSIYIFPILYGNHQMYKEAEANTHNHTSTFPSKFRFRFCFFQSSTQIVSGIEKTPTVCCRNKLHSLPFFGLISPATISLGRYCGIFLHVPKFTNKSCFQFLALSVNFPIQLTLSMLQMWTVLICSSFSQHCHIIIGLRHFCS